jgi:hypothetical protein
MKDEITIKSSKIQRKKKIVKVARLALLIFLLILLILYIVISIMYSGGNFTITLDRNLYFDRGLIIYDDPTYKVYRTELYAKSIDTFDNISYNWLPDDLNNYQGSHNGENYVAYSFFIENQGTHITDYYSEIVVTDVIKNVDEAMRIMVYKNGEETIYAKASRRGTPEVDTAAFETDSLVKSDRVENFKPGDIVKYTIVIWLEGSDPECTDNILGGEVKVSMDFKSEIVD